MSMPTSAAIAVPRVHLLSNGRYTTMLTDAGSGWTRWCGRAVTRWREDPTRDAWGSYLLLRDADSGGTWSATRQPMKSVPQDLVIEAGDGIFTSTRRDGPIETRLTVAVMADNDAELRCLTISNHDRTSRVIEVTSYSEPVLGSASADASHPAFSKLFLHTEWIASSGVFLATRRQQSPSEGEIWYAQVAHVEGQHASTCEYESDRARFLGRCRGLPDAAALDDGEVLSESAGNGLDAIVSLRRRVRVAAAATVKVVFWSCLADSREEVLALANATQPAEHCDDIIAKARVFALSARSRFAVDTGCAERCRQLLAALLYSNPAWRAPYEECAQAAGGAPVLWAAGISGDRPIALLNIEGEVGMQCVTELLRAQRYWQFMGVGVDVVLLNRATGEAGEELACCLTEIADNHAAVLKAATDSAAAEVFCLREQGMDRQLRAGLMAAARAVLPVAGWPVLDDGAELKERVLPMASPAEPSVSLQQGPEHIAEGGLTVSPTSSSVLLFDNGFGGFSQDGSEYVTRQDTDRCTPLPWSNIVANPDFGFIATAEGGGHTFSGNSQQNPLTPWPNDPVTDEPCEVLYLRDNDSGELWTATPRPIPGAATRRITRHGKGWTSWSHACHSLDVDLLQCVPVEGSVKLSRLRIRNDSGRRRNLSVTAYLQWALGANGSVPGPYVITSQDVETGAVFAANRWRAEFGERVAFADLGATTASFTCDRGEFLGAFGSLADPAALRNATPFSGWVGAGRDPCAALQSTLVIEPGKSVELRFVLGDAASATGARDLVRRARALDLDSVLGEVRSLWDGVASPLQVNTPDAALNILLNQWLLYQVLSCRLWARTAYYQSSGAYGFRDQLQDVMALCISRPDLAREHLLRAASRQFVEGDVQHWWLPPAGQGIRSRMTDDRLWLPYSVVHYTVVSGDTSVLDTLVAFLDGPVLKDDQHESFFTPSISQTQATLYEHCARAVDASLELGPHQLPLMGTGDWNDGMNRVGEHGKGESIWLGWFLLDVIARVSPIAEVRGDTQRVARWREVAETVKTALEGPGWDGAWYRRAYYDDGTPLGSAGQEECRIDSIAQSWAVMSGAADPDRARQAMAATDRELVDRRHHLARLFTPPFDHGSRNPGYIKAYPPGVRENGGQYTHGCIWSIFAWAKLGDGDKAWELFDFFNPIRHARSRAAAAHFGVEPYVSCADVYSVGALAGRGGWTWYSGSAGWLYRAGIEALLGFDLRGDELRIHPCIPATWPRFDLTYRTPGAIYRIEVENPDHVASGIVGATLDGVSLIVLDAGVALIPLAKDGEEHQVRITMGAEPRAR